MSSPSEVLQRYHDEVKSKHNVDALNELVSDNVKASITLLGPPLVGRETLMSKTRQALASFPDITTELVTPIFSSEQYACMRYRCKATHTGPAFNLLDLKGVPPMTEDNTGRHIEFTGTTIVKVEQGKIVEEWTEEAALEVLLQLGFVNAIIKNAQLHGGEQEGVQSGQQHHSASQGHGSHEAHGSKGGCA